MCLIIFITDLCKSTSFVVNEKLTWYNVFIRKYPMNFSKSKKIIYILDAN